MNSSDILVSPFLIILGILYVPVYGIFNGSQHLFYERKDILRHYKIRYAIDELIWLDTFIINLEFEINLPNELMYKKNSLKLAYKKIKSFEDTNDLSRYTVKEEDVEMLNENVKIFENEMFLYKIKFNKFKLDLEDFLKGINRLDIIEKSTPLPLFPYDL
jgi:hypothetical protein